MRKFCTAVAAALAMGTAAGAATLDFETYAAGDVLTDLTVDGIGVEIVVDSNGAFDQAMIFDTDNPTGGDTDLAAPFTNGSGGTLSPGKVLIISEDGDSSDPDDEGRGGKITFNFDRLVRVTGFDVFDDVSLVASTLGGDMVSVVLGADNMFSSVAVSWNNVTSLTFDFGRQSGAIDNIQISAVPLPAGLPMLVAGLGGLFLHRRRKKA